MTADGPNDRMEEFRRRMASSTFTPLDERAPSLARRAREMLVTEFVSRAGIAESRRLEVLAAARIDVGEDLVRITLGDLGTVTASWDGSAESLDSIVTDRAWAFSD
ncbi:MAG: hypothetical protein ACRD0C_12780, partial [Acidimicrobiia bacterium]